MASQRNSNSDSSESINSALAAAPRPGGYVKIADYSPNNGNGKKSKTTSEVEISRSRAQLMRSIQNFYTPKCSRTASKTKQVCPRRVLPCLPSCTSTTAASSDSEDDVGACTGSANFLVCQDGELNNILGVVISTVMVLAQGEHTCSNDHLLWTAHFLETIKDEHGRMPPNVAGILNYIKYIRLKEEKDSEEDKTKKKEEEKSNEDKSEKKESKSWKAGDKSKKKEKKSKSSKDDKDKSEDDEEEGYKSTEETVDDEDRPSSASSTDSRDEKKGERRKPGEKSRGADVKKKERKSVGRKTSAPETSAPETSAPASRRSSRVSFVDERPERKKETEDDDPPPLEEES